VQAQIGKALIYDGYKDVFAECGRNFGKTELAAYLLWRWALTHPGTENYLFEPEQKQAKEIVWAPNRIQGFGPGACLSGPPNNTEMRIRFKNGSFIKVDGSDNYEAYRGVKPKGLIIYDEVKNMKPQFFQAFEPNRAAHDCPALWIGTPASFDCFFNEQIAFFKENPKTHAYFHAPSSSNPHISKAWLDKKQQELKDKGDYEEWLREYEALYVRGGKTHLLPQIFSLRFGCEMPADLNRWDLYIIFDPASSSTFAVLFVLYNPYTKRIKIFDEIYEQDPKEMRTKAMAEKVDEIIEPLKRLVKGLSFVYDEAAAWFMNEISEHRPEWWLVATQKSTNSKEHGLGLIKDLLNDNMIEISEKCEKLRWEAENYVKDKNGKIPKANDHLLDNLRYFLADVGYEYKKEEFPMEADPLLQPRFHRMEEEMFAENPYQEID